jgi:hypothetical protein
MSFYLRGIGLGLSLLISEMIDPAAAHSRAPSQIIRGGDLNLAGERSGLMEMYS